MTNPIVIFSEERRLLVALGYSTDQAFQSINPLRISLSRPPVLFDCKVISLNRFSFFSTTSSTHSLCLEHEAELAGLGMDVVTFGMKV